MLILCTLQTIIEEIVTLCCLVHFFIVTASIAQPDGTAPMAEFADVFDPAGDPQAAMVGMMQVRYLLHDIIYYVCMHLLIL